MRERLLASEKIPTSVGRGQGIMALDSTAKATAQTGDQWRGLASQFEAQALEIRARQRRVALTSGILQGQKAMMEKIMEIEESGEWENADAMFEQWYDEYRLGVLQNIDDEDLRQAMAAAMDEQALGKSFEVKKWQIDKGRDSNRAGLLEALDMAKMAYSNARNDEDRITAAGQMNAVLDEMEGSGLYSAEQVMGVRTGSRDDLLKIDADRMIKADPKGFLKALDAGEILLPAGQERTFRDRAEAEAKAWDAKKTETALHSAIDINSKAREMHYTGDKAGLSALISDLETSLGISGGNAQFGENDRDMRRALIGQLEVAKSLYTDLLAAEKGMLTGYNQRLYEMTPEQRRDRAGFVSAVDGLLDNAGTLEDLAAIQDLMTAAVRGGNEKGHDILLAEDISDLSEVLKKKAEAMQLRTDKYTKAVLDSGKTLIEGLFADEKNLGHFNVFKKAEMLADLEILAKNATGMQPEEMEQNLRKGMVDIFYDHLFYGNKRNNQDYLDKFFGEGLVGTILRNGLEERGLLNDAGSILYGSGKGTANQGIIFDGSFRDTKEPGNEK